MLNREVFKWPPTWKRLNQFKPVKENQETHQETLLSMDNEKEAKKNVERDDLERLMDDHPYLHEPETKQSQLECSQFLSILKIMLIQCLQSSLAQDGGANHRQYCITDLQKALKTLSS